MLEPELEWAKHMRDEDSDDECLAMFCAEFNTGERICSTNVNWFDLKKDFDTTKIGEAVYE